MSLAQAEQREGQCSWRQLSKEEGALVELGRELGPRAQRALAGKIAIFLESLAWL